MFIRYFLLDTMLSNDYLDTVSIDTVSSAAMRKLKWNIVEEKMKVVIFGATRGTGLKLTEQALEQGHQVTAFVRDRGRMKFDHANLRVFEGDVMNESAVERAVAGQDAVISAIGGPASSKDPIRSEGTRNIIRAMEKASVRRFISLSTHGVGETRKTLPFLYKYVIVPIFLRQVFADHEVQERYISQSRLDWTIVRPTALSDGPRTGAYLHGFPATEMKLKNKIARADVADFMLKQLLEERYLRAAPCISY
jgi:putative NADH-flavin reductase